MSHSRLNRARFGGSDDGGFTLIEIIVAVLLFVIASAATSAILITALKTVRDNQDRVYAANIARTEIDALRATDPSEIVLGVSDKIVMTEIGDFTVETEAQWAGIGSDSVCNGVDTEQSFLRVHVEVTGGRLSAPQSATTIVTPKITVDNSFTGNILVRVLDENAQPVKDAKIEGVNSANQFDTFTVYTGAGGCVFIPNFEDGSTWVITATRPSGVDEQSIVEPSQTTTVTKDQTAQVVFGLGESYGLIVTGDSDLYPIPSTVSSFWARSTYMPDTHVTGANLPYQYAPLYPVESGYTLSLGPCANPGMSNLDKTFTASPGQLMVAELPGVHLTLQGMAGKDSVRAVRAEGDGCAAPVEFDLGKTTSTGVLRAQLPYGNYTIIPTLGGSKTFDAPKESTSVDKKLTWDIQPVAPEVTKPGAPLNLAVNGSAVATWNAPSDNGNAVITSYTVKVWTSQSGGTIAGTCSSSGALTCTIAGLTAGTTYYADMYATNVAGNSVVTSPRVSFKVNTAVTVPGAPTGLTVNDQSLARWSAPASDGGANITGYTVRVFTAATGGSAVGSCTTSGALTCTIAGLGLNVQYFAEVFATNSTGNSTPSAPRVAFTPKPLQTVPGPPSNLQVSTDSEATWNAPADDGNSPITGYTVNVYSSANGNNPVASCTATTTLTCAIIGLTLNKTYYAEVFATNSVGDGQASSPRVSFSPKKRITVPGAPTDLKVDTDSIATWAAPADDGGDAIIGYTVTVYANANGNTVKGSCVTGGLFTCTIDGLTLNTTYYAEVTATNSAGEGPASSPRVAFTPKVRVTPPSAPRNLAVTPAKVATWTAPADLGNGTISNYTVNVYDNASGVRVGGCSTAGALTCTIPGLTNNTVYKADIVATNEAGAGPASDPRAEFTYQTGTVINASLSIPSGSTSASTAVLATGITIGAVSVPTGKGLACTANSPSNGAIKCTRSNKNTTGTVVVTFAYTKDGVTTTGNKLTVTMVK